MTPNTLKSQLVNLIALNHTTLVVSSPGMGKTSIFYQAVSEIKKQSSQPKPPFTKELADLEPRVMQPVMDDPTNYRGMPVLVDGAPDFVPYATLKELCETKTPIAVLVDDFGQASKSVQGALMQLVLARNLNGNVISDKVRFVLCTNKTTDRAGVSAVITPLLSRMKTILNLEPDVEDWAKHEMKRQSPPEVIYYVRSKPEVLEMFDPNFKDSTGNTIANQPCPRTLSNLADLWKDGFTNIEVLAGAVGQATALEFDAFAKLIKELGDLPMRIAEDNWSLDDSDKIRDTAELSVKYALLGAIVRLSQTGGKLNTKATIASITKFVSCAYTTEFQARFLQDLGQFNEELLKHSSIVEMSLKVHAEMDSVYQEAV